MSQKMGGLGSTYLREGGILLHCRLQINDLSGLLQKPTNTRKLKVDSDTLKCNARCSTLLQIEQQQWLYGKRVKVKAAQGTDLLNHNFLFAKNSIKRVNLRLWKAKDNDSTVNIWPGQIVTMNDLIFVRKEVGSIASNVQGRATGYENNGMQGEYWVAEWEDVITES